METALPQAVRWARRFRHRELDYTKWHYTEDSCLTICGHPIPLAVATTFPEEDLPERTDCKHCQRYIQEAK